MRYQIKVLDLGGILDQGIELLRNHFVLLFTITLFLMVPLNLIQAYVTHVLASVMKPDAATAEQMATNTEALRLLGIVNTVYLLLLTIFVSPLTNAAVIRAIADNYLGESTSAVESFKHALKVFIPLILTGLLKYVIIYLGFLAFIVPGIIFMFRYWFASHVVIIEGKWGRQALRRSGQLMKGNMSTAFILGLLVGVLTLLVVGATNYVPGKLVTIPLRVALQAVLYVFGAAAGVVFYFSARCKLEHFDLQLLADAVAADARVPGTETPTVS
jgi:hypothetical protein